MNGYKDIGLHLRLMTNVVDLIQQAVRLQLPFFQCFLLSQVTKQYVKINKDEEKTFLAIRHHYFSQIFLHGSYWINLACADNAASLRFLKKELEWAKQLAFTHIILHPGCAKGCATKEEGIDNIVRGLNSILRYERDITIVLENTAHGNKTIGNDIQDLGLIQQKLEYPERIQFCIDTAHAYAYGYNIADEHAQTKFIDLLEQTIGIEHIALIHLNDTKYELGLKQDSHAIIGNGMIGTRALKCFMQEPRLQSLPVLLELPMLTEQEMTTVLKTVRD